MAKLKTYWPVLRRNHKIQRLRKTSPINTSTKINAVFQVQETKIRQTAGSLWVLGLEKTVESKSQVITWPAAKRRLPEVCLLVGQFKMKDFREKHNLGEILQ
ncbi:uncharacterized protein PHA67_019496 isoform 2-T3 [Liasis olivaceus]